MGSWFLVNFCSMLDNSWKKVQMQKVLLNSSNSKNGFCNFIINLKDLFNLFKMNHIKKIINTIIRYHDPYNKCRVNRYHSIKLATFKELYIKLDVPSKWKLVLHVPRVNLTKKMIKCNSQPHVHWQDKNMN